MITDPYDYGSQDHPEDMVPEPPIYINTHLSTTMVIISNSQPNAIFGLTLDSLPDKKIACKC